jgi:hypothetical protein
LPRDRRSVCRRRSRHDTKPAGTRAEPCESGAATAGPRGSGEREKDERQWSRPDGAVVAFEDAEEGANSCTAELNPIEASRHSLLRCFRLLSVI